jgi:hypothetical protein
VTQLDELVLYYGIDASQENLWHQLLLRLGLKGLRVGSGDLDRTVGRLVDLSRPGSHADEEADRDLPADAPTESIIVMHGLTNARINELLTSIRQAAGLTITLKAVVTESNRNWPFRALASELKQEHALMTAYQALQNVTRLAESWLAGHPDARQDLPDTRGRLEDAMLQARSILARFQQGEADIKQIAACGREIASLLADVNAL